MRFSFGSNADDLSFKFEMNFGRRPLQSTKQRDGSSAVGKTLHFWRELGYD